MTIARRLDLTPHQVVTIEENIMRKVIARDEQEPRDRFTPRMFARDVLEDVSILRDRMRRGEG